MAETLKIVIPMAGWGTRMRPHTWSKPKPLVSVAGKTSLDHLLDMFKTLPHPENIEYVFIVGPFLGELQIPTFISENYPHLKAHYIVQHEMKGQSHALWLARKHFHGPMIICFSDTLMETDFSFTTNEIADGVAWVKPVPDPRRFGVAELDQDGWVTRFIEKPENIDNNLVVVGCYFFKESEKLLTAIEDQLRRKVAFKGEYYLVHAITIMIDSGAKVRTQLFNMWLDTGTIEATLETNKVLLERGLANKIKNEKNNDVEIIAPSFIHPSAKITNSIIGPFASIGPNCIINNSLIKESIIESDCEITDTALNCSMIGKQATIKGGSKEQIATLNLSDNSSVIFSRKE